MKFEGQRMLSKWDSMTIQGRWKFWPWLFSITKRENAHIMLIICWLAATIDRKKADKKLVFRSDRRKMDEKTTTVDEKKINIQH